MSMVHRVPVTLTILTKLGPDLLLVATMTPTSTVMAAPTRQDAHRLPEAALVPAAREAVHRTTHRPNTHRVAISNASLLRQCSNSSAYSIQSSKAHLWTPAN
jgi:uncharacterized membrane protein YccF (DUF307 family)